MVKDELTYAVIGCAMKVHNTLGNGFQEVIYQRCLALEMEKASIDFTREVEQTIYYHGVQVGTRRADFIVENKLVVELKGWKICPMICYDLRFPVWMRNVDEEYDMLIIVANWPEKRALHWRTLIPARAVENQSYVIGLNRVGHDGNEVYHSGDSTCISPNGDVVYYKRDEEDIYTFTINAEELKRVRRAMPFLRDADKFEIKD